MRKSIYIVLILFIITLAGCAKKTGGIHHSALTTAQTIGDIRDFPQNLDVYADLAGKSRRLLSEPEQEQMNNVFNRIYFGPWSMSKTSIKKRDVYNLFNRARGFKDGQVSWTQMEWDAMRQNANPDTYPSRAQAAITLRNTDLRELPTHERRFSEPTTKISDNPFDYFQYSLLPPGMPLLVAHATRDGRWYYVECPIAGGWVDAADIAFTDEAFRNLWMRGQYAALVRDKVSLPGTGLGGGDSTAGIGTILPLVSRSGGQLRVLVPVREKTGYAGTAEISLSMNDAKQKPLAATPKNIAAVGNVMMGQPYGWGGMTGLRDCSAMTRDLFTPFGIWLPRNSVAQARRGAVISLSGLSANEKAKVIMNEGVPFLSLVGMRGHITLYVGQRKGKPAIFHNVWGVRIVKDGNDDERFVIGRAVVTSITPGTELENLYRPVTFVDRLRTLSTPGY